MKKFGLIGGTSWHSTVEYYTVINKLVNEHYGNNTNPPLRLINLNQKEIHDLQRANDWNAIANIYTKAALELQGLGVEGIALCANTPHKVFEQLEPKLACPIVHIADAIAASLKANNLSKVGLLGTQFTMSQDFIKGRLLETYQIETLVPISSEQYELQNRIYDELVIGIFNENTKTFCLELIESLAEKGAEAIILSCTELPILLQDVACPILTIDSLQSHCEAIVQTILNQPT